MCRVMEEMRNQSYAEGREEGRAEGRAVNLIQSVENLMKNLEVSLDQACKALGISSEEYRDAKAKMEN